MWIDIIASIAALIRNALLKIRMQNERIEEGLLIFFFQFDQYFFVRVADCPGGIRLNKVNFKRLDGCFRFFDVITNYSQGLHFIKMFRHYCSRSIVPYAVAVFRKLLPGKVPVGIHFPAGSDIGVPNEISSGYVISSFKPAEQLHYAADLCVGECFKTIIIYFNSYAAAVDIRCIAPFAYSRMMRPEQVIQHMMYGAILANYIVGADLGPRQGKCF